MTLRYGYHFICILIDHELKPSLSKVRNPRSDVTLISEKQHKLPKARDKTHTITVSMKKTKPEFNINQNNSRPDKTKHTRKTQNENCVLKFLSYSCFVHDIQREVQYINIVRMSVFENVTLAKLITPRTYLQLCPCKVINHFVVKAKKLMSSSNGFVSSLFWHGQITIAVPVPNPFLMFYKVVN